MSEARDRASPAARMGAPRGPGMMGPVARARDPQKTLRRLASYFVGHRAGLAAVIVAVVVSSLLGLAGPYLMGRAIDGAVRTGDLDGLRPIAIFMITAYVTTNLLDLGSSWTMAGISQQALARLRRDLFAQLQALPMGYLDRHASGDLMSRLTNDVDAINQAVAQNVTALVASVLSMVGIVVAMFVLDAWLAIAALVVIPIMLGFTRFVAVYTRRGFADLQRGLGALVGTMEETLAAQKVITAFQRHDAAIASFREQNERVYRAGIAANTYALLLMPLTGVLGNLFVIVLVGLGGWLALDGLVTVGLIATFVNYGQNFVQPLRQISNLYNTLQGALAGAERVFEILDTPRETDDGATPAPKPTKGHVTFEDVSFSYTPGRKTIDGMTLDAKPGETIALVGATGAGKTTILNLLTRFYEIDSGTIRIDGVDIRDLKKSELRAMLGLVLQETFLFGATVMENLRYGRLDATDEEVREAARTASAEAFILQLPNGYDTMLSERATNLSQGQRQLLAIARTLLARPPILVLDEATSSVDTRTEANIQRSLLHLREGRTSFVIAHRLSTIRDADQLLVLDQGRIVERGTHDELLEKKGVYHRLYTSQFKGHAI